MGQEYRWLIRRTFYRGSGFLARAVLTIIDSGNAPYHAYTDRMRRTRLQGKGAGVARAGPPLRPSFHSESRKRLRPDAPGNRLREDPARAPSRNHSLHRRTW